MKKIMAFDLKAFNNFFISYQKRFIHFAFTYVHDMNVAEDFVLEAMMYYWENKDSLSSDTNVPAYVLTVVKHKCIDFLRHQKLKEEANAKMTELREWELRSRIDSLNDFEPKEVFTKEILEIVDKTLASLPERTRTIFTMSRNECRSYKEIADVMGLTSKGVEFHIAKATQVLRVALKDYLTISVLLYYFS